MVRKRLTARAKEESLQRSLSLLDDIIRDFLSDSNDSKELKNILTTMLKFIDNSDNFRHIQDRTGAVLRILNHMYELNMYDVFNINFIIRLI